jgi:hypothetical protein
LEELELGGGGGVEEAAAFEEGEGGAEAAAGGGFDEGVLDRHMGRDEFESRKPQER